MSLPKVTIIILNYNGLQDTINCLKSVLKTRYDKFGVIVVDNGSITDERKILKEKFKDKRLEFFRFRKNLGFSGGNNKILKKIKDKYVVLLNNDTEVTPNWLNPLIETLQRDRKIAAIQPKIRWLTNKKYFDYAGACGGFIDMFGYPFTRGRIFDTQEVDRGQYDNMADILWASGAAMGLRTSIFKKIGYFDELFFNYMEEIDLCFRIYKAGHRVVCNPKSVVYHKGAASSTGNEMKKRFWEHRNSLLLMLKNYPLKELVYIFPARIILEYASLIYYLITRQNRYAIAVIFSQISFFKNFGKIIKQRSRSEKNTIPIRLKLNFSIASSYFISKKRTFSKIMFDKNALI